MICFGLLEEQSTVGQKTKIRTYLQRRDQCSALKLNLVFQGGEVKLFKLCTTQFQKALFLAKSLIFKLFEQN